METSLNMETSVQITSDQNFIPVTSETIGPYKTYLDLLEMDSSISMPIAQDIDSTFNIERNVNQVSVSEVQSNINCTNVSNPNIVPSTLQSTVSKRKYIDEKETIMLTMASNTNASVEFIEHEQTSSSGNALPLGCKNSFTNFDLNLFGADGNNKQQRFLKTQEALQHSGLLDITMKTANLLNQQVLFDVELEKLKSETSRFIELVLSNPENAHLKSAL